MEVTTTIRVAELDGKETTVEDNLNLIVKSHWNHNRLVDIEIAGHTYTVVASMLTKAIENAQNHD